MSLINSQDKSNWFYRHPYLLAVLSFSVIFSLTILIAEKEMVINTEKEHKESQKILAEIEDKINEVFKSSYVTTLSLALTIDDKGEPKNFEYVAEKLFEANKNIDALELLPGGVVKYIYPYENNKNALGLDVLKHESSREESIKAIDVAKIYFAGPINLKEGGYVIIGRLPIYTEGKFWGYSAIIIDFKNFLEISGINNLKKEEFSYAFTKTKPNSEERKYLVKSGENFDISKAEKLVIEDADWVLYLHKNNLSIPYLASSPFIIFGFFLALGFAILTYFLLKKPLQLQKYIKIQARKLLDSELKYKAIFQEAGMGIIYLDDHENFLEVNTEFLNSSGYRFCDIAKLKFSDIIIQSDRKEEKRLPLNKFEAKLICKNLEKKEVRITKSSFKVNHKNTHILLLEDITSLKESENSLRELSLRMEMAIRLSGLGYWEWNTNTNEIVWSENTYKIFGVAKTTQLTSQTSLERIHEDDVEEYKKIMKTCLNTKKGKTFEVRLKKDNGEKLHVLNRSESYQDKDGNLILKGIVLDITQKKETLINLQHSYQTVVEQNERLLNFSYIVSHNLRSHSSNIQSIVQLIKELETYEEKQEMFGLLAEVAVSLNDTLTDLNEVIHIQKNNGGIGEDVELKFVLNRIKNILRREIKTHNISIKEHIPSGVILHFNAAYLESVILNIVSNAIKYRDPNKNSEIILNYKEDEKYKILEIKDNGIGMDLESNKNQIFGMYETFTDFKNSRGIGLFVSNNQMEALGGKIEIESTLNKGSVFRLYFKK
ncbi:PAS domain S-box protein [Mesonia aestuariivivens]|uniref:histidine kinase n=1 Tax=Mesonia aestuariivivens TaxID=2796128 RepID=A0ABS6VXU1_9FLAO|nr:PAS domain S-box protein [Mesonia aestuariivivens]MBW2960397.1 PAS domain S-box protein [Mesonia aestuariivivens]